MEAFDVFGCPMPRREERERLVVHLANMWGLHKDLTIKRLMCSKPELKLTETTMQIGRVQLTRSLLNSEIKDFEMPAFTLRLMERLPFASLKTTLYCSWVRLVWVKRQSYKN